MWWTVSFIFSSKSSTRLCISVGGKASDGMTFAFFEDNWNTLKVNILKIGT